MKHSTRWMTDLSIMLVTIVVMLSCVHALGIAPSREIIDYDNEEHTIHVRIINNEHQDRTIMLYADGELQDYVSIPENKIVMAASEAEKEFVYKIRLPEGIAPGTRELNIIALEIPGAPAPGKTPVLSQLSLKHQLRVNVPYPGTYAEGVLYVSSSHDEVTITANVINKGQEALTKVSGELVIRGPTNAELARIPLRTIDRIEPGSYQQFVKTWKPATAGEYLAEVIINYAGKNFVLKKVFDVGNQKIDIRSLTVKNFKIGSVAKFDFEVVNEWNSALAGVYGDVSIMDKNSNIIEEIKTITTDIPAQSTAVMSAYWETAGVKIGEYDIKAVMHYLNKTSEKVFGAVVGIDSFVVQNNPTGNVISSEEEAGSNSLLYVIIILLVVINIGWFAYYRHIRSPPQG